MAKLMYHTQESRAKLLTAPIKCNKSDAWLGVGYYFWNIEIDATHWGNNFKNRKGSFEIYKADIDTENVLDTVFNEKHYEFWLKQIEKAAKFITKKTGKKASIREINQYFNDKAKWSEITDGVLFQDLPFSDDLLVSNFNYRKRIQIAVYNKDIISNFVLHQRV
ncbi:MAG: hypothetical protein JKX79_06750 [Labilibaculum sp.]|nr:hypothetical protein [Labilibaculum sp.]